MKTLIVGGLIAAGAIFGMASASADSTGTTVTTINGVKTATTCTVYDTYGVHGKIYCVTDDTNGNHTETETEF